MSSVKELINGENKNIVHELFLTKDRFRYKKYECSEAYCRRLTFLNEEGYFIGNGNSIFIDGKIAFDDAFDGLLNNHINELIKKEKKLAKRIKHLQNMDKEDVKRFILENEGKTYG